MYKKTAVRIGLSLVLMLVVLSGFLISAHTAAPPGAWWNTDWQYRMQITVSPSEPALQAQAIPEYQALFEGESIRIQPVVEADPDGYDYSVVTEPASSNWDAVTGTWTWTTTYLDIGAHQVTFRATDKGDPGNTIDLTGYLVKFIVHDRSLRR